MSIRLAGSPAAPTQVARNTAAPTHGSRTLTLNSTEAEEADGEEGQPQAILRLRGSPTPATDAADTNGGSSRRRRVVWADDTVDNEHLGKKSSKICCIYHKPRAFDESDSDESSSSEGSGSDSSDPESDSGASLSPPDSDAEGAQCDDPSHRHNHGKPVSFPFKHGKHPNAKKSKGKGKKKHSHSSPGTRSGSRTQTVTVAPDVEDVQSDDNADDDGIEEDRRARKPNRYERGTL